MKIIAGLGNPGAKYERTRHNAGFWVVDAILRVEANRWLEPKLCRWKEGGQTVRAWVAQTKGVAPEAVLVKPMDFMNQSGLPVAAAAKRYEARPDELLAVCDDADLPWGKLRLRPAGSSGGQNGLRSIIESIGTESFARLRVGIGRPQGDLGGRLVDYVLGDLTERDWPEAVALADRAAGACRAWLDHGVEFAMNRFNG